MQLFKKKKLYVISKKYYPMIIEYYDKIPKFGQ